METPVNVSLTPKTITVLIALCEEALGEALSSENMKAAGVYETALDQLEIGLLQVDPEAPVGEVVQKMKKPTPPPGRILKNHK